MEILLLLGLGFLLFSLGRKPGKNSGNSTPSTASRSPSPFRGQAKTKKERDEEEFCDMMMALDDEDEMDGL